MIRSVIQMPFWLTIILLPSLAVLQSLNKFTQNLQIQTSPVVSDNGTLNIRSICFADCKSCQLRTGDCETCYQPWFKLDQGRCILAYQQYTLQSTNQERRSQNFIPSSQWWKNQAPINQNQNKTCKPDQQVLNKSFNILGPFTNNDELTYQRTITRHNYFGIKFMLILTNWRSNQTNLNIKLTNEQGKIIINQQLRLNSSSIKNAIPEKLCSANASDIRASVTLNVIQQESSQLFLQIKGNIEPGANWALSSFVLVSGPCNQSCQVCIDFTPDLKGCSICKNFLADTNQVQKCNTCLNGFSLDFNQRRCQKCPIQYKQCQFQPTPRLNVSQSCLFPNLTNIDNKCNFKNVTFFDKKELTQKQFFGSYYVVQNKGAIVTRCGAYSVSGPANFGEVISATFVQLPPHIQMSINVNLFIFDQQTTQKRYTIAILVDGQPIEFAPTEQTINITGTSNQCDLTPQVKLYEAIKTFQTQTFFKHNKINNTRISIGLGTSSSNFSRWGIRDVRLVFKRCDQNCEVCTQLGCQRCKGLFTLKQFQCKNCLDRTGISSDLTRCIPCPDKCLKCNFIKVKIPNRENETQQKPVCTQCVGGFYLYTFKNKTTCQSHPNYGVPITKTISNTPGCAIDFSPILLNFDSNQNSAFTTFNFPYNSTKKKIQFYLIKYGDWQGDFLDIYANDLRIKRIKYQNEGGSYCGSNVSNEYVTFQEFQLQDDNNTLSLQFQAVRNNVAKNRKFGVSNLTVFPVGCAGCSQYSFNYKTKYNYDQRLFIELAFNLVYQNSDPEQFKNIFRLKAGERQLSYDVVANDSIRYWLRSENISQSQILQKNISVQCLYPQRVFTQIPNQFNEKNAISSQNQRVFFQQRLLQANNRFQGAKTLDNNVASVFVDRFSPLKEQQQSVMGSQVFFNIITRIVIYLGFASFFIGCQTSCTHVMHNFQKLWVHIYVASLALSPVLKTALWGFRQSQNQNIAVNPEQWQAALPKYLYYDVPAQFQQYYKDITFFRNIYNVGVAFAILAIVFVIFHFAFKKRKPKSWFMRHMKITFFHRPLFYFNSIIYYQYFTVVLACCLQFLDLKTHTNQQKFAGINAAACIIAFIFATLYPIFFTLLLDRKRKIALDLFRTIAVNTRNKQFENNFLDIQDLQEQHVIYNNRYSEIFYRFLPKNLWNALIFESELISEKHFFYNLFRYGDLWWHAILVILMHHSPFAQTLLLLITNGFHLAVNTFSKINTNKYFRIMKSLQLVCFMVIQVMIIVMYSLLKTLRIQSYVTLGIVALIFVYFIVALSFVRFLYTLFRLYRQYQHTMETDQRSVIRQEKGFERGCIRNPELRAY